MQKLSTILKYKILVILIELLFTKKNAKNTIKKNYSKINAR